LILALAGLFSCLPTLAGETLSICVTNKSGEVFTNLSVGKVLGDGLLLENSAGQFKVKYADLPADVREKYQAGAQAAAQKEQADAEANARYVAGQRKYQAEEARLRATRKLQEQKAPAATPAATGRLKIEVPNQGWSIVIWNCGFGRLETDSGSRQFVCRGMAGNGLNLSIFVESPEGTGMRPEDVYAFYWPKASRNPLMDLRSVKMETLARFVKVSYTTAGMPNVNYYFAHKGKWVDVHISMLSDAATANKAFEEFESQLSYGG
jgi:hypothetical protein